MEFESNQHDEYSSIGNESVDLDENDKNEEEEEDRTKRV